MGAVGALAPTVFLPNPEIIHTSVPLFLPRPEVVLIYLHPCYLVQFGASEPIGSLISNGWLRLVFTYLFPHVIVSIGKLYIPTNCGHI